MALYYLQKEYDFMKELRLAGVIRESIVDGPGMRMTIFTQGCSYHCAGCHNPQTHDFSGGYISHPENILKAIDSDPILSGVTFSGGEPFRQCEALAELAKEIRNRGLNVLSYTGFTFEQLYENFDKHPEYKDLLEQCDWLIDGRFVLSLRTLNLRYRGSKNQRIIDVQQSLKEGKAIETEL